MPNGDTNVTTTVEITRDVCTRLLDMDNAHTCVHEKCDGEDDNGTRSGGGVFSFLRKDTTINQKNTVRIVDHIPSTATDLEKIRRGDTLLRSIYHQLDTPYNTKIHQTVDVDSVRECRKNVLDMSQNRFVFAVSLSFFVVILGVTMLLFPPSTIAVGLQLILFFLPLACGASFVFSRGIQPELAQWAQCLDKGTQKTILNLQDSDFTAHTTGLTHCTNEMNSIYNRVLILLDRAENNTAFSTTVGNTYDDIMGDYRNIMSLVENADENMISVSQKDKGKIVAERVAIYDKTITELEKYRTSLEEYGAKELLRLSRSATLGSFALTSGVLENSFPPLPTTVAPALDQHTASINEKKNGE